MLDYIRIPCTPVVTVLAGWVEYRQHYIQVSLHFYYEAYLKPRYSYLPALGPTSLHC
jgi:hypothetical protein